MKKDLDYYMALPCEVVVQRLPGCEYFATIPDLPGCMATEKTEAEARTSIDEAKPG